MRPDRRLGMAEAGALRVSCHAQIARFWVPGLVGLARQWGQSAVIPQPGRRPYDL